MEHLVNKVLRESLIFVYAAARSAFCFLALRLHSCLALGHAPAG